MKGSNGFAIQRYETAHVAWVTSDGVKHEQVINLKEALPTPLHEAEVWFKIRSDGSVEVLVVDDGADPRFSEGK